MRTLRDKVIIITGAGGSIAGAVEEAFRREGARLVLVDKDKVRIQGRSSSYGALALENDFATLANAQEVVSTVKEEMGHVDGLVHLVGEVVTGQVADATEEDYEHAFDTNMRTLFNATKAVLPELLRRDEGFIASVASQGAWGGGSAGRSLFAASKSAAATFLRSLDAELRETRVGVAIAFPMGPLDTLTNRQKLAGQSDTLIHPKAVAKALVGAALSGEEASLLELPINPPRHKI